MNRSKRSPVLFAGLVIAAAVISGCDNKASTPPENSANAEKVGVLITGWGEPQGFDFQYRKDIGRSRGGAAKATPWEACTEMYAGHWPYSTQVGLLPFAVAHKFPLLGAAWDSMGVYRKTEDGNYVSVLDPSVTLKAADIPQVDGMIKPISESTMFPERSINGIDPRDGKNYLEGIYQIGQAVRGRGPNPLKFSNGLGDADEIGIVASMADMGFMYEDQTPRPNMLDEKMTETAITTLKSLFGDRVDARFGAYAATPGIFPAEEDVALDFAREGYRKLVLARETTDNNHYANMFMTRGIVYKALCQQGWADDIAIEQTRQVGRTPEYNTMLLDILRPYLERREKGSEVALVYTTYGMPFPGGKDKGPFGVAHPLAKDVYHENAYFNYQSFKRYAKAAFGKDYSLAFNRPGKESDLRTDSYYAYAMFPTRFYGEPNDPLRFPTIRETIDQAKKDGRRDVIVLLSHWNYTNTDNMLGMRKLNQIPYNSREDVRNGKTWIDWCEKVDSPAPVDCAEAGAIRLSFTEVFDRKATEFGVGFGHRLRTAVERFGLLPEGVNPVAKAPVTQLNGGSVSVADGELAGVSVTVPADPAPGKPESFEWNNYEAFVDPAKPFVGAWEDYTAYIAPATVGADSLAARANVVSPVVLVGPYRTLMNKSARISLPFAKDKVTDANVVRPYIYNEVTRDWDPVYDVAGGEGIYVDFEAGKITFDTQVFGMFVLAAEKTAMALN